MVCQICGGKTTVADTIMRVDVIYRKRKYLECGHKFYTEETDCNGDEYKEAVKKRDYTRRATFKSNDE